MRVTKINRRQNCMFRWTSQHCSFVSIRKIFQYLHRCLYRNIIYRKNNYFYSTKMLPALGINLNLWEWTSKTRRSVSDFISSTIIKQWRHAIHSPLPSLTIACFTLFPRTHKRVLSLYFTPYLQFDHSSPTNVTNGFPGLNNCLTSPLITDRDQQVLVPGD